MVRTTILQAETARLRSQATRRAGHLVSGLEVRFRPAELAAIRNDPWLKRYWKGVTLPEPRQLYAAIVDPAGVVLVHSDPKLEGGQLGSRWYERVVRDAGEEMFEIRRAELTGGPRALDIRVPIEIGGRAVAEYHEGIDADWLDTRTAAKREQILWRWGMVIGAIVVVVLLAGWSLHYIARRSLLLRQAIGLAHLQRFSELGQLTAGLAHEIRNPLHAIRLNLHTFRRVYQGESQLEPDEVAAMIDESNVEIERVEQLMHELLGFTSPEAAHEEVIDLGAEVEATRTFVTQGLLEQQNEVSVRLPEQKLLVRMDPSRLRQIMLNLLMNASDAVEEGGRIEVAVARRGGRAEITVCDNGPGVPPTDRQRIFEPFYSTKQRGSGLGLALVKRFVEEADGTITCEDASDTGACFRIVLPERVK